MTSASVSTLRDLRLGDMAAAYEAILSLPLDQQPDGHEMLARLVDAERQGRAHRRTQLNLRLSKLRYAATLQGIDCAPERNLSSSQLAVLSDPAWMARGENVIITCATGCGKSYLACALGDHACSLGKRTLYFNMNPQPFTKLLNLTLLCIYVVLLMPTDPRITVSVAFPCERKLK